MFVSRVGIAAEGAPFAWRIESVFAELLPMYLQKKSTMIIFSELQNMNEEYHIYKKKSRN